MKKLFIFCVALSSASMVTLQGAMAVLAGGGELNQNGQMRGNYLRDAFNNIQKIIRLQDTQISQARDMNKKTVNAVVHKLAEIGKRLQRRAARQGGK